MRPIIEIAEAAGIDGKYIDFYGRYKAKLTCRCWGTFSGLTASCAGPAITPTPAGEGKTTTTIGLADGLARIESGRSWLSVSRRSARCSVSGAAGGGYAQVVPMEDINLNLPGHSRGRCC